SLRTPSPLLRAENGFSRLGPVANGQSDSKPSRIFHYNPIAIEGCHANFPSVRDVSGRVRSPVRETIMYYADSVKSAEDVGLYSLLVVMPAGVIERPLPSQGRITIGRGEDNGIRVDDPSVSRRHAALDIGDTLRIEDLGGANGTYVQRV